MLASSRSYAIGMAHFKIAGGWLTVLVTLGLYLMLVAGMTGLYFYSTVSTGGAATPRVLQLSVTLLLVGQSIGLTIFGSFRVSGAIRADIGSRMIESHRLMPIASWRAIAGYLVGAGGHALAFGLLSSCLIFLFGAISGVDLSALFMGQCLVFIFTLLFWTLIAFATFHFRYIVFVMIGLVMMGGCAAGSVYALLPAVALLIGPFLGDTVYVGFTAPSTDLLGAYVISCLAQIVLLVLLFLGACRKYRGTFPSTFNVAQAMLFLLAWAGISAVGTIMWKELQPGGIFAGMMEEAGEFRRVQIVASVVSTLLVAVIPVRSFFVRERQSQVPWPQRFGVFAATALMGALVLTGAVGLPEESGYTPMLTACAASVLILMSHVWSAYFVFRLTRGMKLVYLWLIMVGGLLALWVGPLFLDLARILLVSDRNPSFLEGASPIGLLYAVWVSKEPPNIIPGVLFLGLIPLVLGAVVSSSSKRRALPQPA